MDQYELAELRRAAGNRLGGFYNSFRYAANRALWILPHLSVGKLFSDTLGRFYPFSVNSSGVTTINSSINNPNSLNFHNTVTAVTDVALTPSISAGGIRLQIQPNETGTTKANVSFAVADYNGSNQTVGMGMIASATGAFLADPVFYMQERMNNDAAPVAYTRILAGQFLGGLDATGGTLPVTLTTKAGTPNDTDFAQYGTPPNGTVVIDTSANKIWVRIGGTWKSVGVS